MKHGLREEERFGGPVFHPAESSLEFDCVNRRLLEC